ncbi:DUF3899 domain-containing protein [Mycoplasma sp. VS42A]|uniref:DUF3899 domain-containing protein n=1 Tax=unclassified Mycoplasma TaxID=2683645 RepID=UPI003A84620C
MNKYTYKIGLKLKNEFTSLRFYLINLVFLVLYFAIVIPYYIVNKDNWNYNKAIDAFSVPAFITFFIAIIALVLKLGFLERTFKKMRLSIDNIHDAKEQKDLKKMPNEEKRLYLEKKKLEAQKREDYAASHPKTKFPFVFASVLYLILSIAFIIVIYA